MPKTMKLLAFLLTVAAAGSAMIALPVASKEFTFDEKANKEMARKLNIPADVIVELGESRIMPTGLLTPTAGA